LGALFNLGFRPFFLGASVFAVLAVALWMAVYVFQLPLSMGTLSMSQWHAHEMIYGYGMAVIAGFLLTAVKNWTGIQTIHGKTLAGLFAFWVVARLLFLAGAAFIKLAAIFDLTFIFCLFIALTHPVIQGKNWRQLGILSKVLLLYAGNVCFYLGAFGILQKGVYWGIYGGLYLVISLILLMGGRVIPFFIERGVGYPVQLYNPKALMLASLLLFIVFFVVEVFIPNQIIAGYAAAGLFVINAARLIGWHTPGIWKKPLLWGLYSAFIFIVIGFLLFALSVFAGVSRFLAIHAFAYGGIGIVTMAMMGRVAIGHTGRDINHPPATLTWSLLALIAGAIIRVGLPLVDMDHYVVWIVLSQVLWIGAFLVFAITYAPILIKPRIDGQFG
jgi:uncharacterized protein involved in response to NO